ncbi:MAG: NAD-dependent epimerase/dehydratase family protein [Alphaproteobacteria bacterium]|nr:NAD-dependent epimerase/dehydratase family protein [Alphaproteobacteria bacterium]
MTGATGYIGGSVAAALIANGHQVHGLVRSPERAELARAFGIEPLIGSLDDLEVLEKAAQEADAVINTANADHEASADALVAALAGSGKKLLHTSGSSIVGHPDGGELTEDVFDESTEFVPSPGRAARVDINNRVLAGADSGVHSVIICPSLIYGLGTGVAKHSMQVPWLIDLARELGAAKHIGPGANTWSNVHIDDLVDLYLLALEKAPAGAFYFAENGENSMREVCVAISKMLGFGGGTEPMTADFAATHWGEGPAHNTMASNSRVRAKRARSELGWSPSAPSLVEEIETGIYATSYPA